MANKQAKTNKQTKKQKTQNLAVVGREDIKKQKIKHQRHYLADKVPSRQSYGFSSSHIWT